MKTSLKNKNIVQSSIKILAVFLINILIYGCAYEIPDFDVNAKSAVIVQANNGYVLFDKNGDGRFPPASTAKIMTAIVALDNFPKDELFTPTENVLKVEPTIIGLKPGVKYAPEGPDICDLDKIRQRRGFCYCRECCRE